MFLLRNVLNKGKVMDKNDKAERCVGCGKIFSYPKTTPIDDPLRNGNYIQGGGQVCDDCAKDIYDVKRNAGETG